MSTPGNDTPLTTSVSTTEATASRGAPNPFAPSNHGVLVEHHGPEKLTFYHALPQELTAIAAGNDTLELQLAFLAIGIVAGSSPAAYDTAVSLWNQTPAVSGGGIVSLVFAVSGLWMTLVCIMLHRRRRLSPDYFVSDVLKDTLDAQIVAQAAKPLKTGRGMFAKYGAAPSAEDIDENRREVFSKFGQDF